MGSGAPPAERQDNMKRRTVKQIRRPAAAAPPQRWILEAAPTSCGTVLALTDQLTRKEILRVTPAAANKWQTPGTM